MIYDLYSMPGKYIYHKVCCTPNSLSLCECRESCLFVAGINCNYIAYSLQFALINQKRSKQWILFVVLFAVADGYKEFCCPSPPYFFNLLNVSTSPSVEVVGELLQHISFSLFSLQLICTLWFFFSAEKLVFLGCCLLESGQGIAYWSLLLFAWNDRISGSNGVSSSIYAFFSLCSHWQFLSHEASGAQGKKIPCSTQPIVP